MSEIYCDHCDYAIDVDFNDIPQFHNELCPKCGAVLIDDQDIEDHNHFLHFVNRGFIKPYDHATEEDQKEFAPDFTVDTGKRTLTINSKE